MRGNRTLTALALAAMALALACGTTNRDDTMTTETTPGYGSDLAYDGTSDTLGMGGTNGNDTSTTTGTDGVDRYGSTSTGSNTQEPSGTAGGPFSTSTDAKVTAKVVEASNADVAKNFATIEVNVDGANLGEPGQIDQGEVLISYKVDDHPAFATADKSVSFTELKPGTHTVVASLIGADGKTVGQSSTVTVNVPSTTGETATR